MRGGETRVKAGGALPWLTCSKLAVQICRQLLCYFKLCPQRALELCGTNPVNLQYFILINIVFFIMLIASLGYSFYSPTNF